jgi:hypothetical protein
MDNSWMIWPVMAVALVGCAYFTYLQRLRDSPSEWGVILWADVTLLIAAYCLSVVFFECRESDMYTRIKDHGTLIAAAIAASALAWQTIFSK